MRIGVPREIYAGEKRVATTPDVAGAAANYSDAAYESAGCTIAATAAEIWADADIILKVRGPEDEETARLKAGQTLISFLWPAQNSELLQQLTERGVTAMAMDSIPRISRAQKVDALSSMANIACWSSVRALPGWPLLAPPRAWARSFVPLTPAPKSRSRLRAWTPSF